MLCILKMEFNVLLCNTKDNGYELTLLLKHFNKGRHQCQDSSNNMADINHSLLNSLRAFASFSFGEEL